MVALLALLAVGCNVEREWVTSRGPSEAEAAEEAQEQAAFFDIEGSPELDAAARRYQDYVNGQSELLVDRTAGFVAAVKGGDVEEAKRLYAPSRVPWERIEPVAEKFGTLDPEVDAREGDVPETTMDGLPSDRAGPLGRGHGRRSGRVRHGAYDGRRAPGA